MPDEDARPPPDGTTTVTALLAVVTDVIAKNPRVLHAVLCADPDAPSSIKDADLDLVFNEPPPLPDADPSSMTYRLAKNDHDTTMTARVAYISAVKDFVRRQLHIFNKRADILYKGNSDTHVSDSGMLAADWVELVEALLQSKYAAVLLNICRNLMDAFGPEAASYVSAFWTANPIPELDTAAVKRAWPAAFNPAGRDELSEAQLEAALAKLDKASVLRLLQSFEKELDANVLPSIKEHIFDLVFKLPQDPPPSYAEAALGANSAGSQDTPANNETVTMAMIVDIRERLERYRGDFRRMWQLLDGEGLCNDLVCTAVTRLADICNGHYGHDVRGTDTNGPRPAIPPVPLTDNQGRRYKDLVKLLDRDVANLPGTIKRVADSVANSHFQRKFNSGGHDKHGRRDRGDDREDKGRDDRHGHKVARYTRAPSPAGNNYYDPLANYQQNNRG